MMVVMYITVNNGSLEQGRNVMYTAEYQPGDDWGEDGDY